MVRRSIAVVALILLSGCTDLDQYAGSYSGTVVGAEGESFIRRGFPAGTILRLEAFDPPPADGPLGVLVGVEQADADDVPLFRGELERIAPLAHDQLSLYEFPGGGRLKSYIFVLRPTEGDGGLVGREAMVFLSLMEDAVIEIRMVAGSGDESRGDHFGLFILEKL